MNTHTQSIYKHMQNRSVLLKALRGNHSPSRNTNIHTQWTPNHNGIHAFLPNLQNWKNSNCRPKTEDETTTTTTTKRTRCVRNSSDPINRHFDHNVFFLSLFASFCFLVVVNLLFVRSEWRSKPSTNHNRNNRTEHNIRKNKIKKIQHNSSSIWCLQLRIVLK